jgi:hypothetical protein
MFWRPCECGHPTERHYRQGMSREGGCKENGCSCKGFSQRALRA